MEEVVRTEPPKSVYCTSTLGNVHSERSPPLPARSPLRPRAMPSTASIPHPLILSPESVQLFHTHTLSSLSTSTDLSDNKLSVPLLPEDPLPLSPVDNDDERSSTSSILNTPPTTMSKRTHALLELLSSERAYASDLALIRDIHIPLALGQPSPFNSTTTSPHSSGSSSRTVSTASDSSSTSSTFAPAMTKEDTKIIFTNISDLAVFSDTFTGRLEEALGSVLEGGHGQDHVGALFLEMIPALEPPYKHYITRHPTALEHLSNLPQTPSLNAYLQQIRTLASSLTHAWDLPSLLIKPVQRLLKYSLLLTAIIDGTPDDHADKQNLKVAKEKMDEVARGVNEGRRRREVVKEVLNGGKRDDNSGTGSAKKKGLNIGVATSVSLGKMKGLRSTKLREGSDENHEKEQVERMEVELKQCDAFIRKFAKEAVDWGREVKDTMYCLSNWTESFGRVIGISEDQISESYDAFRMVVNRQILLLCNDLNTVIKERLLTQLAILVDTMLPPLRLLEAMHTLEPLHYGLLNLNISKSRPPPALLEASQSYVALRGQLSVELPQYLALLHKGIVAAILQLGVWQGQFWGDVRERWGELWEALRVDGEMNVGDAPETVSIWWERFSVIDAGLGELEILKKRQKVSVAPSSPRQAQWHEGSFDAFISQEHKEPRPQPTSPQTLSASRVLNILSALEPTLPGAPAAVAVKSPVTPGSPAIDSPRRKHTARRPSDASKQSRRSSFRFEDDFDVFGTSPISPLSLGSHVYMPNVDQIPAVLIRRKSFGKSPVMEATRSSPPYNKVEQPREHSRGPGMRRKLTDPVDACRAPPLPSLTKTRSFGFPHRSSSPVMSMPNGDTVLKSQPTTPHRSGFSAYVTPVMYECEVMTAFDVGRDVVYEGILFHRLKVGNRLGILQEAGHPFTHPNLPIHIDDGEDCLLLARNIEGVIGWVFASFLTPVD